MIARWWRGWRERRALNRRAIPDALWSATVGRYPFIVCRTAEELAALGDLPNLKSAARLLHELVTDDEFEEFLTLPAYESLDQAN